jgi:hypothetical protein
MPFKRIIGTRAEVWHGTAKKTPGGLTKNHLMMNKHGRIVSRAKHATAKREMRLVKHGFGTKKGKFGFVKIGSKKHHKGSKKMHGGSGMNSLSPASATGSYMIKDVVPQHFSPLDYALTGGKRSHRKQRGGVAYGSALAPADFGSTDVTGMSAAAAAQSGNGIDGQGITNYGNYGSADVQLAAGQAGGKKHRHRKMRGGTTSRSHMGQGTAVKVGSPLNQALNAV